MQQSHKASSNRYKVTENWSNTVKAIKGKVIIKNVFKKAQLIFNLFMIPLHIRNYNTMFYLNVLKCVHYILYFYLLHAYID